MGIRFFGATALAVGLIALSGCDGAGVDDGCVLRRE